MFSRPLATVIGAIIALSPVPAMAGTMSFAELRHCATLAVARSDRDTANAAQRAILEATRERLARTAAQLEARRETVDRTKIGEIALFNDSARRACAEYAAYVEAVNALAAADNELATAYNEACADRDYSPAVVASLPTDLRAAWNRATTNDAAGFQLASLGEMPAGLR